MVRSWENDFTSIRQRTSKLNACILQNMTRRVDYEKFSPGEPEFSNYEHLLNIIIEAISTNKSQKKKEYEEFLDRYFSNRTEEENLREIKRKKASPFSSKELDLIISTFQKFPLSIFSLFNERKVVFIKGSQGRQDGVLHGNLLTGFGIFHASYMIQPEENEHLIIFWKKALSPNIIIHEFAHAIYVSKQGFMSDDLLTEWKTLYENTTYVSILENRVFYTERGLRFRGGRHNSVSDYGASSKEEDFAESLSYYVTNPLVFIMLNPKKYNFFKKNIFAEVEYLTEEEKSWHAHFLETTKSTQGRIAFTKLDPKAEGPYKRVLENILPRIDVVLHGKPVADFSPSDFDILKSILEEESKEESKESQVYQVANQIIESVLKSDEFLYLREQLIRFSIQHVYSPWVLRIAIGKIRTLEDPIKKDLLSLLVGHLRKGKFEEYTERHRIHDSIFIEIVHLWAKSQIRIDLNGVSLGKVQLKYSPTMESLEGFDFSGVKDLWRSNLSDREGFLKARCNQETELSRPSFKKYICSYSIFDHPVNFVLSYFYPKTLGYIQKNEECTSSYRC